MSQDISVEFSQGDNIESNRSQNSVNAEVSNSSNVEASLGGNQLNASIERRTIQVNFTGGSSSGGGGTTSWGAIIGNLSNQTDLQAALDAKASTNHNHNDLYYTEAEVDALIPDVITDHGGLSGLADDDHPQYHNDTRGDVRYYTKAQVDTSLDLKADDADLQDHISDTNNPHNVTLAQVGGTIDHGGLQGLSDDDHPQYHNDTRGDARYYTKTQIDTSLDAKTDEADFQSHVNDTSNPHDVTLAQVGGTTDHGSLGGLSDNDHPQYLLLSNVLVATKDTILGTTPSTKTLAYATDTEYFYFFDGSSWRESATKFGERSDRDIGNYQESSLQGYGEDYITDKQLSNVFIGSNVREENGAIRTNLNESPDTFEIFLRNDWQTILYDLTYEDGDFRHAPLSEEIEVWSGNSIETGLNGLPTVQEYQVSMGAYPVPRIINLGTF